MTRYYVATLSTYVLVDAANEGDARTHGEAALQRLLGRPVQIWIVRPATADEIALQNWFDEAEAGERR